MKQIWLDAAVALWVIVVGVAFIAPLVFGLGRPELELVGRYVYLGVVSAGLIGLALRAIRITRR